MKLEELNRQFEALKEQQISEAPTEEEPIIEHEMDKVPDRKKDIVILGIALIIILGTTIAITLPKVLLRNMPKETEAETKVITSRFMNGFPEPEEGVIEEVSRQQIGDSVFSIFVNTLPVFQNGQASGKIYITNSAENQYPCKVTLTLDKDSSVLYKSGDLLYPDQYIPEIMLWKNLSKGVYNATLTYLVYEGDTETQAGVLSAKVQIVIQD